VTADPIVTKRRLIGHVRLAATGVIQDLIDEGAIEDRQEYAYELREAEFQPVRNPKWWIKV
jgi:hypothetical protein